MTTSLLVEPAAQHPSLTDGKADVESALRAGPTSAVDKRRLNPPRTCRGQGGKVRTHPPESLSPSDGERVREEAAPELELPAVETNNALLGQRLHLQMELIYGHQPASPLDD